MQPGYKKKPLIENEGLKTIETKFITRVLFLHQ